MDIHYYWVNDQHEMVVYLGMGLSVEDTDQSVIDSIIKVRNSVDFKTKLYDTLSDKTVLQMSLLDLNTIMNSAKLFSDFTFIGNGGLEVYFLNKLFGKGVVITHIALNEKKYNNYKKYEA